MKQGILDRQYVSSIQFMDQREILKNVLDIYDEMDTIADIMQMTDRYVPTSQEVYNYHVNTRLYAAGVVNADVAEPVAGAASTIALTAGSVKPIVNSVMMTAGGFRAFVSAVSGNSITVKPVDSTLKAHEALTATDEVTFFTNGYAEGTGVNPGYVYPTKLYSNNIQIIKNDFTVTDLQAMTKVEVEFEGKNYYFIKGQNDAFSKFKMDVAHALMFGQKSNNLTDASGNKILLTQGLEKTVQAGGINLPLRTDTQANTRSDIKAFTRAIQRARGPKEYWMWNGADINNAIDDWLTELPGVSSGITYASFNGLNSKERAIALGFDAFKIYGITFHKKVLDILDNPGVTAAKGFDGPSKMFLIPGNKVKTQYDTEAKDRFLIRYLEAPQGEGIGVARSDQYYEIRTGGLSTNPTDKTMTMSITYNTWQGPEFLGVEHFATTT